MFRYWSGHYTKGDSYLVLSSGVGNSPPCERELPRKLFTSLSGASERKKTLTDRINTAFS